MLQILFSDRYIYLSINAQDLESKIPPTYYMLGAFFYYFLFYFATEWHFIICEWHVQ